MGKQLINFAFALRYIFLVLCVAFVLSQSAEAQVGVYIGSADSIHVFGEDSVSVFQNVLSDGVFGSNVESDVIFYGQNWQNNSSARFPGNGRFTFEQPSSLGSNVSQSLGGVNWDNRFPNMTLRNANDVNLFGVSGNRDTFTFDTGCVIHNKFDFVIGNSHSGVINNYKETKYFVTNHTNTSDSGFLIRHGAGAAALDFPVGQAKGDYTPARLVNNGTVDTFSVRVFPNVYVLGNTGSIVSDITVQRTWNIFENTPGGSSVDLTLQHNDFNEGSNYTRNDQYVSRYYGAYNNAYRDTANHVFWDYAAPGNGYANTTGTITTGSTVGYMATRSRSITTNFSPSAATRYFTKASTTEPIPVKLLYLSASWINKRDAELSWSTATELNNKGFAVFRSYDGITYEEIDFVPSLATNGNSFQLLNYSLVDRSISPYIKTVYYKLKQIDFDNSYADYGPIALTRNNYQVKISAYAYPNPALDRVFVNISGELYGKINYTVVDILGQAIYENSTLKLNQMHTIELPVVEFSSGNYWIRLEPEEVDIYIKPIEIIITR